MKVIITGSKDIEDYKLVADAMQNCNFNVTEVVCGNARGIETLGYRWAQCYGKAVKQIQGDWDQDGNPIGDSKMVSYCDAAVIIWDGKSQGTRKLINQLIKKNKPYYLQLSLEEE
jgi:hypothetical protein